MRSAASDALNGQFPPSEEPEPPTPAEMAAETRLDDHGAADVNAQTTAREAIVLNRGFVN